MAVAYVKDTGIKTASSFATTTGSFATLPTVGNHVIVGSGLWTSGTLGIDAVTDNQSNSYAENGDPGIGNGTATLYSCKVATSSGTYTLTLDPTSASGNYAAWGAVEVSGLDATTHLDQTGEGTGTTTGDVLATASGANSTADGIAIAVAAQVASDTDINISDTPPSGYTNIIFYENSSAIIGFSMVYKIYSASETSSAQFVHDNTSQEEWAGVIATYKMAAAGGTAVKDIIGSGIIPFAR